MRNTMYRHSHNPMLQSTFERKIVEPTFRYIAQVYIIL